jgi:L-histidine Nalpha-methyltransferase
MIPVHAMLTENAIAEDFVSSLRARRLAEKFFYWFPLSVRAWLALCSDGAYRNFVRSRSLIARSAKELADVVHSASLEVVSLGAGQGDKDLILLEAFVAQGARVQYVPVDTSQALVEMACGRALDAGIWSQAIKADLTRPEHIEALTPGPDSPPRLVLLLGNTLGAFDPLAEARVLRALLRPQDHLLVDGEVYAGSQTVAGYDNPLNRRFAWAPLESVGIGESDGDIVFEDVTDDRLPGLHPLRKHFRAHHDLAARLGGETLAIRGGERVEMNHSYKYAADTFLRILADAGLDVRWRGLSEDGRFQMVLAGPK